MLNEIKEKELWIIIALIIFTLINAFWLIPQYIVAEGTSSNYPSMLNWIFGFFSFAYAIDYFVTRRKRAKTSCTTNINTADNTLFPNTTDDDHCLTKGHMIKVVCILILVFIWVFLLGKAGFLIATPLFLSATSWVYGERNIGKILLLSILFPLVIFVIFHFVNSSLPAGVVEKIIRGLLK